jgi:hypothetical protein
MKRYAPDFLFRIVRCDDAVDRIVVEIDEVKNATTSFDEPTHKAAISKHLFGRLLILMY